MPNTPREPSLYEAVTDLTKEVKGLREDVALTIRKDEAQAQFASRKETNLRRKASLLLVAFLLILSMQLNTAYVNACSPGARANAVVDALLEGKLDDIDDVQKAVEDAQPAWFCDTIYPFNSTHDEDWPSEQNYVGFAIYAFLGFAGFVWYRTNDDDEDFVPEDDDEPIDS